MSNAAQIELGSVVSLWRYPVKSMMGEELNAAGVTERGLLGDRAYALVDSSDGKVATAKNPRKWPRLFDFRANLIEPARAAAKVSPVRIALPDGTTVTSDQDDLNRILSKAVNREVMLRANEAPNEAPKQVADFYCALYNALEETHHKEIPKVRSRDVVIQLTCAGVFLLLATIWVLLAAFVK